MKDQNDNLNNAGIDLTTFINSSVRSPIEREDRSNEMVEGVISLYSFLEKECRFLSSGII